MPAAAISPDEPIMPIVLAATAASGRLWGMDGWYDGATFTLGGTPTLGFGLGNGSDMAHVVDECIPVADFVAAAQALAVSALRFCDPTR